MSTRSLSAAKALMVLSAVGLLLSGCYYHRPYYGGPHLGPQTYGYQHHYHGKGKHYYHGKGKHYGKGKHRGYGHHHRGYRGY
ncbi:MAG: hypothetical protein ACFCUQ_20445 [Kiloniellales bacterium]